MFLKALKSWKARGILQLRDRTGKECRIRRPMVENLESRYALAGLPIEVSQGADYEGDSGSKFLEFQVSLIEPISQPLAVDYSTSDLVNSWSAAEAGNDYAATSGTLYFEPGGATVQILQVEIFCDMRWESNEQFLVTFTPSDGSGSIVSEGFIANDDGVPKVGISDSTIVEGSDEQFSYAEFTITRTGAIGDPLTLAYETSYDTAGSEDLLYVGEWITMEAGEASRTVYIPIHGDKHGESNETFFVNLYSGDIVEITDAQGLGTIVDDDSSFGVIVSNPSFAELDSGVTAGFFAVELHEPHTEELVLHVRTADGTAIGGSDYSILDQTIVFGPGETSILVPVSIFSDVEIEGTEQFALEVYSNVGEPLAMGTAVIVDNDYLNHPPVVFLGDHYASEWTAFELYFPSQFDPDQPNSSLLYELDLDFDGMTFEGGPLAPITPAALGWDGPSSHTIALRVIDEKGAVSNIATATVHVFNEAPLATVGPDLIVDEGTTVTALAQYFDVDPLTFHWHLVSTTSGQTIPDQATPELEFVADAGTYTFEFTATDDEGASSFPKRMLVTARDIQPNVDAGPDQTVLEGATVTLNGIATNPGLDTLDYQWRLVSSSNEQAVPDQYSANLEFTPADQGTYVFELTVTDDDGAFTTDTVVVTVNNSPPVALISGTAGGVRGQTLSFELAAGDASAGDLAAGFTFQVDWGDGSAVEFLISGTSTTLVQHVFANIGSYEVLVTTMDKDGSQSDPVAMEVDITHTLLHSGTLYVGGSDGNDTISVNSHGNQGNLAVAINGLNQGTFSAPSKVVVYGGAGNDTIAVQANLTLDAWLFGGDGNDVLASGRGNDILSGGTGADVLSSNDGKDLLLGGAGRDVLAAGSGDDILISGTSSYEADELALLAIMSEWLAPRDYVTRQRNLQDGSGSNDRLNEHYFLQLGQTVLDDEQNDTSAGGGGSNWLL